MYTKLVLLIMMLKVCYLRSEIEGKSFVRRFAIKIRETDHDTVFHGLQKLNCQLVYRITPESFIFEYQGAGSEINYLLSQIKRQFINEVVGIEKIIVYTDYLIPGETIQQVQISRRKPSTKAEQHYYGMGVPEAWALGYTGKGVVLALTDVGIHINILDLKQNIKEPLCYNFHNDSKNVTPEVFHILPDIMSSKTSHGDNCAGLIASVFGNGICTCGIAYDASIVAYKIFNIMLLDGKFPITSTRSDIISRALVRNLSDIDIFSNAWSPKDPFSTLDLPTKDAIKFGAEKGRRGLGLIHVFPAGPTGNEYSNNIYTIAVNGISRDWAIPRDSNVNANVMTCGLAEGSNLTANYMKTVAARDRCVTSFGGVSASTAQVSAIIALGLEANPNLTLREVQHLLIKASEPVQAEKRGFLPNGAGIFYHSHFGFGLLSATKLVILAKESVPLAPRLNKAIKDTLRNKSAKEVRVDICYECDVHIDETCLNILEHVMVEVRVKTWNIPFRIILISPSGTKSVLVNYTSTEKKQSYSTAQLISVHFWNEMMASGVWRLIYTELQTPIDGNDFQAILTLYGTRQRQSNQTEHSMKNCYNRTSDNGKNTSFINETVGTGSSIKKTTFTKSNAKPLWFYIVFPSMVCIFALVLCDLVHKRTKCCMHSTRKPPRKKHPSRVFLLNGSEVIQTIENPIQYIYDMESTISSSSLETFCNT